MCLEERDAIFFGCGCYIRSPIPTILGIQPCTSVRRPVVCDLVLNGRPRAPFVSRYTRFIKIRCAAHVRAGPSEIGENGREMHPTFYRYVYEFVQSKAFDNNKNIKRVKKMLMLENGLAEKLFSDLAKYEAGVLEAQNMTKFGENMRLINAQITVRQATAARKAAERAVAEEISNTKMGALRPQLGPGFAALALRKRREEAKAHKALEETLVKKRSEEAKALEELKVLETIQQRKDAQAASTSKPTWGQRSTDTVAPWHQDPYTGKMLRSEWNQTARTAAAVADFLKNTNPHDNSASELIEEFTLLSGLVSKSNNRTKLGEKMKDKGKERCKVQRDDGVGDNEMEVCSKMMTLNGVNLYE